MSHERMVQAQEHEAAMKHEAILRREMEYRMQQQQQQHRLSVDQYDPYTQRRLDEEDRRRMEGRR